MNHRISYLLGRIYDLDSQPWKSTTIKEIYEDLVKHLYVPGLQLDMYEYRFLDMTKYFVELKFTDKESELAFRLKYSDAYLEDLFSDLLVL